MVNSTGRTALHLAVKSNRIDAARFLVKCGCDTLQKNNENESPLTIAIALQSRELIATMKSRVRKESKSYDSCLSCIYKREKESIIKDDIDDSSTSAHQRSILVGIPGGGRGENQNHQNQNCNRNNNQNQRDIECGNRSARLNSLLGTSPASLELSDKSDRDDMLPPVIPMLSYDHNAVCTSLYTEDNQGDRKSHALHRLKPSRFSYAFLYALIILGYWILTICIPFYIWFIFVVLSILVFR